MTKIILVLVLVLSAVPALAPAAAQPTSRRGQILFLQCRACHTLRAGEPHKVGPNLNGIIGAPAGTRSGYDYTQQLKTSGLRWTDANLDRFLAAPTKAVKGNRMAFTGIAKSADRLALIAFLKDTTR